MNFGKKVIIFIVFVMVITVIVYYITNRDKKEQFCTCNGMKSKMCMNPQKIQALYNSGELTEFTELPNPEWPVDTDYSKATRNWTSRSM